MKPGLALGDGGIITNVRLLVTAHPLGMSPELHHGNTHENHLLDGKRLRPCTTFQAAWLLSTGNQTCCARAVFGMVRSHIHKASCLHDDHGTLCFVTQLPSRSLPVCCGCLPLFVPHHLVPSAMPGANPGPLLPQPPVQIPESRQHPCNSLGFGFRE